MKKKLTSRRTFLQNTGKASIALGFSSTILSSFTKDFSFHHHSSSIGYSQQPLPYSYSALEVAIDAMTMEIHYTKHAALYAKNLNEAIVTEKVDTTTTSIEALLAKVSKYSTKLRNNAGGHYNHELFWQSMSPNANKQPSGQLLLAIEKDFGSFETFKTQFTDAGKNRFGSGWAWLVINRDKKLIIGSTPNQDNPLMDVSDLKGFPLLGLDVWEHAYYLRYQNKRPDYIHNWWNIVNWNFIEKRFESFV